MSVALRAPEPRDLDALAAWRRDPETQRLLMSRGGPEATRRDVEAWIERRARDPDGCFFVVASGGGTAIGFAQLTRIDRASGHAHVGLFVDEAERGRGAAADAHARLEEAARGRGLRKLVLEVLASNERAVRFWRGRGFATVGTLAAHFAHGGAFHDVLVMEKLI